MHRPDMPAIDLVSSVIGTRRHFASLAKAEVICPLFGSLTITPKMAWFCMVLSMILSTCSESKFHRGKARLVASCALVAVSSPFLDVPLPEIIRNGESGQQNGRDRDQGEDDDFGYRHVFFNHEVWPYSNELIR
jgi:hypothetical protein